MLQLYFLSFMMITFSLYMYGSFVSSFVTYMTSPRSANNQNLNRTLALENLV